jgi:hypothetical protein
VLYYADEEDANYHKFHLPDGVLEDLEGDEVLTLAQLSQLKRKMQKNDQQPSKQQRPAVPPQSVPLLLSAAVMTNLQEFSLIRHLTCSQLMTTDNESPITTIFKQTEPKEWKEIGSPSDGRHIDPLPFTGESELFTPKIDEEMIAQFKDASGDI